MYVALAVILVWLGIGSIFAKRWARNLLLIFSWSWLVMGCLIEATAAIVLPMVLTQIPGQEGRPAPPAYVMWIMIACLLLFYGVIFVVLPAIWTYFYNSRHVKGTCEWRDPNPGWTDACPPARPGREPMGRAVGPDDRLDGADTALHRAVLRCLADRPVRADALRGPRRNLVCLRGAALPPRCAGLVGDLITVVIVVVSSTVTYSLHDMIDVYKLMDYPQDQIDQLQKISLFKGHMMAWMTGSLRPAGRRLSHLHQAVFSAVGSHRCPSGGIVGYRRLVGVCGHP